VTKTTRAFWMMMKTKRSVMKLVRVVPRSSKTGKSRSRMKSRIVQGRADAYAS
jgi:hypothetical protein